MKQNIILIVSVVIGIFAGFLTRYYLVAKDNEVKAHILKLDAKAVPITVMAAARPIPKGTVLKAADLGTITTREGAVRGHAVMPEDAIRLLGRRTTMRLDTKAPVFWTDIEGGKGRFSGLSDAVIPGMRAISINVSGASAVSSMVLPNDRVDVLGTFTFPSADAVGEQELVTLTVLQDVTILATGQQTAKNMIGQENRRSGGYSLVTLSVTPREAEMLVFAQQVKGRLTLSLRNPEDVGFERDLPRVDFDQIEVQLRELNLKRQADLRYKTNVYTEDTP